MQRARWAALGIIIATVVVGMWSVAATNAIEIHADAPIRSYGTMIDSAGEALAFFSWVAAVVAGVGVGFAMLAGMRRNYLPSLLPAALAVLGASAALGLLLVIRAIGKLPFVTFNYDSKADYSEHVTNDFHVATSIYVSLAAAVILIGASVWLYRIARGVQRQNAAELATVNRDLAVRDGDLVANEPKPEDRIEL